MTALDVISDIAEYSRPDALSRIRAYMDAAIDWYADSPAELLEELLKADWHQHKAMHSLLEKIVAAAFAGDRISADMLTDFRRLALAAIRPALEAKAEELADAMLRARQETSHD